MTDAELLALEDTEFVERAYREVLGRAADPPGLRGYLERVRSGTTKRQVLDELRGSEEAARRAARRAVEEGVTPAAGAEPARTPPIGLDELLRVGDTTFVEHAYRVTLGRPADPIGRSQYLRALRRGAGRLEVLALLLDSPEGRRHAASVPDIRMAIERQSFRRVPVVRYALRLARRISRLASGTRRAPSRGRRGGGGLNYELGEGVDPMRSRDAQHQMPSPSKAMADHVTHRAVESGETRRLNDAAADMDAVVDQPIERRPLTRGSAAQLGIERFVGATLHGFSLIDEEPAPVSIEFAGRALGRIVPLAQEAGGEGSFSAVLGGILQFSLISRYRADLRLAQLREDGCAIVVPLAEHRADALTFSPMRALMRGAAATQVGSIRAMRMVSANACSIVFEAAPAGTSAETVVLDFYQEGDAGELIRLGRFAMERASQIVDLEFRLRNADAALLMVATDQQRNILATDCFPLPSLCSDVNAPLIEYHVVLESGKPPYAVLAKIARTYFDASVSSSADSDRQAIPHAAHTCMVVVAGANADPHIPSLLRAASQLTSDVVYLDASGIVTTTDGHQSPWAAFLEASRAKHFLFVDSDVHLRPDFWAIVADNRYRLPPGTKLVHWHTIAIDGASRPQVVKAGLLLDPAFSEHRLLDGRAVLASQDAVREAHALRPSGFRAAFWSPEKTFSGVEPTRTALIPVVMQITRVPIAPLVIQRLQAEHIVLDMAPPVPAEPRRDGPGVSAIINYRDGVEDTLRCLSSLAAQRLEGPLEIVLVNNGSTNASVGAVTAAAVDQFTRANVRTIDYPHRFNHSTQCNVAALAARHDTLLMLSNDSVLRTPTAVARSARVAQIPWVGTCGYRIIGNEANKGRLQSLGLALNERRYLFSGASPVTTSQAPLFALDCTFEVIGNTFAAVMLRRSVYRELDGLDSIAFPTNYNDIDFSFRASNAGYRHLVIGAEIVEHMGRGSREADQDLPIDQRIIERAPSLELLARVGFQQL